MSRDASKRKERRIMEEMTKPVTQSRSIALSSPDKVKSAIFENSPSQDYVLLGCVKPNFERMFFSCYCSIDRRAAHIFSIILYTYELTHTHICIRIASYPCNHWYDGYYLMSLHSCCAAKYNLTARRPLLRQTGSDERFQLDARDCGVLLCFARIHLRRMHFS